MEAVEEAVAVVDVEAEEAVVEEVVAADEEASRVAEVDVGADLPAVAVGAALEEAVAVAAAANLSGHPPVLLTPNARPESFWRRAQAPQGLLVRKLTSYLLNRRE